MLRRFLIYLGIWPEPEKGVSWECPNCLVEMFSEIDEEVLLCGECQQFAANDYN